MHAITCENKSWLFRTAFSEMLYCTPSPRGIACISVLIKTLNSLTAVKKWEERRKVTGFLMTYSCLLCMRRKLISCIVIKLRYESLEFIYPESLKCIPRIYTSDIGNFLSKSCHIIGVDLHRNIQGVSRLIL